eukprot:SAG31_NODE_4843_length_2910_cov_2.040911_2_plen_71_part_00
MLPRAARRLRLLQVELPNSFISAFLPRMVMVLIGMVHYRRLVVPAGQLRGPHIVRHRLERHPDPENASAA